MNQAALNEPVTIAGYGDMRFTDPSNTSATNPRVRRRLVYRIAEEHPAAILLSGDIPWPGADPNDYAVYDSETQAWRTSHLRIYPALGNHELNGDEAVGLRNWWIAFPLLRQHRWYSVELGNQVYILKLGQQFIAAAGQRST